MNSISENPLRKPAILITAFLISIFGNPAHAESDSVCFPKAERRAKTLLDRCLAKNQRSTKVWADLQAAKNDVEFYLRSFKIEELADYLDCDAKSTTQKNPDSECKSDIEWVDKSTLKKVSAKLQKREPGEIRLWKTTEPFEMLCDLRSKEPLAVHRVDYEKPCEKDGAPLIELRKAANGVSISRVGSGW